MIHEIYLDGTNGDDYNRTEILSGWAEGGGEYFPQNFDYLVFMAAVSGYKFVKLICPLSLT